MTKTEIALNIACDLLIGSNLYGYDYDRVFEEIMNKEGVVSSLSIKDYILNNLEKLGKEYFPLEVTMENTERQHGEWKHDQFGDFFKSVLCSNCGLRSALEFPFCPSCGANMRKEGETK